MLERWTRAVLHHRGLVIATWAVVVILGLLLGPRLSEHLTTSLVVPRSGSSQADAILTKQFGENIEGTFTVVLPFNKATASELKVFEAKIASAASMLPTGKITQEKAISGILYANVGTSFNLIRAAALTEYLRDALADENLRGALVTGPPALQHDITPVLSSDLDRGAIMALLLALLLLLVVLGLCWALLIPFLVAGATTAAAVSVMFLLSKHFLMVLYIPNIIELIGLGLAIDYSLLIVHRFRAEIAEESASVEDAIVKTMATAGRTVVLAGFTVAIGLATLFLVPVPFVRSLGAAGLVVPVASLVAALTLQPALLSLLGRRGVSPVGIQGVLARRQVRNSNWTLIAHSVIRRPMLVLVSALVILIIAAASVLWLQITPGSLTAVPSQLESSRALALVSQRAGPGIITPNEIVIDLGKPNRANTPLMTAARLKLALAILHNPEVFVVATDSGAPFVDSTRRYERMFVIGRHEFGSEASKHLVRELRNVYVANAKFPSDTKIYVGGASAQGVDFLSSVFGNFPWIVLLALLLAYTVLVRAFRSLVLPLISVVLDLVSVAAAYGLLVVVFRFGVGSPFLGTYHVSQIDGWVLIFLFAMLFGLSMDYEIFIVSRMREAWDRGSTNAEAIAEGLTHTGGVVTAAAFILVGALSGLVFGHVAALQELGVGLSLGVLVDATIVRGFLLPSVMALLGRWNWWLPNAVAKVVRTKASPLEMRGTRL
jgi:RND superfamily putative drug exporter